MGFCIQNGRGYWVSLQKLSKNNLNFFYFYDFEMASTYSIFGKKRNSQAILNA
jgi:hypothetical protein